VGEGTGPAFVFAATAGLRRDLVASWSGFVATSHAAIQDW
jgi:hypothetical protein